MERTYQKKRNVMNANTRTEEVSHSWIKPWPSDKLMCEVCLKPQTLDNLQETCYTTSLNPEQKDLGSEYQRVKAALIKYGSHMKCDRVYGHDCSCGFDALQEEFHIPKAGRG